MVPDVVVTTARQRGARSLLSPDGACPVAAEGGVKDDVVVHEMLIDIAVGAANEPCGCRTPAPRVGLGYRDIGWDTVTGEEPDVDGGAGPFGGVDAAAGIVQVGAIVVDAGGFDGAAKTAFAVGVGEGAAGAGVHGHLVLGAGVDAFEDVDLTAVGPRGSVTWWTSTGVKR